MNGWLMDMTVPVQSGYTDKKWDEESVGGAAALPYRGIEDEKGFQCRDNTWFWKPSKQFLSQDPSLNKGQHAGLSMFVHFAVLRGRQLSSNHTEFKYVKMGLLLSCEAHEGLAQYTYYFFIMYPEDCQCNSHAPSPLYKYYYYYHSICMCMVCVDIHVT